MTITDTPATTADTATILDQAANHIADHGWTPTGLYQPHRNCPLKCTVHRTGGYPASMLGAIRVAVFGAPRWYLDTATPDDLHTYTQAVEWLNSYLLVYGPGRMHASVFDWETAHGRNGLHVITALHRAASAYRRYIARRAA